MKSDIIALGVGVIAILLAGASLALLLSLQGSLSQVASELGQLSDAIPELEGSIAELKQDVELLSKGTGVPLEAEAVAKIVEEREFVEAAKAEGRIRVVLFPGFRVVAEAFEKKYGITVEGVYGGAPEIVRKVLEESEAGIFNIDVFASSPGPVGVQLFPWTAKYESRNLPKVQRIVNMMEPQFRLFYHPAVVQVTGVVYNEKVMRERGLEPPESINDLLKPEWKGQLLSRTPWLGSNLNWAILAYYAYFDEDIDKLRDYLSRLYAQVERFEPSWPKLHNEVGLGEFPAAFFTLPYAFRVFGKDFPELRYTTFVEDGLLWWWNGVGIHKNAPHPNAARLFVDFFLSEEGLRVMAENGYITAIEGLHDPWHTKFLERGELLDGDLQLKLTQEIEQRRDFWVEFLKQFA